MLNKLREPVMLAAATMVQAGFTGVDDVFSGPRNFLVAFSDDPKPHLFTEALGDDPGETRNLYYEKPEIRKALKAKLDELVESGRSR